MSSHAYATLFYGFPLPPEVCEKISLDIASIEEDDDGDGDNLPDTLAGMLYLGGHTDGCVVKKHGWDDSGEYYMAVKDSVATIETGEPHRVRLVDRLDVAGWSTIVRAFADKHDIDPAGMGWWVVACYG